MILISPDGWEWAQSSEPGLWDRSHEIHFDIIKDCRGLVSGAEVIRIREMPLLMSSSFLYPVYQGLFSDIIGKNTFNHAYIYMHVLI